MKKHPIVYMFFSFIMILTFFDIVKKDNSFSELENRNLARKPIFSISSFLEGKYRDKYATDNINTIINTKHSKDLFFFMNLS